ncbi:MAG: hypothetical protein JSW11_18180 [Candidatus Heimdallarchaeota archaeon]|nr:MAG: hypothetical protein JSW11_18180 [Candidatus Heimdallarchaeota archaeon]
MNPRNGETEKRKLGKHFCKSVEPQTSINFNPTVHISTRTITLALTSARSETIILASSKGIT